MDLPADLDAAAREMIDANAYLALGTTEPDGTPRVSPVYFGHGGYRRFYWISSLATHHSANVAVRPDVAMVIFDSTAAVGEGRAVYLAGTAGVVPADELAAACDEAFAQSKAGARRFAPAELSGEDEKFRLYRAVARSADIHVPGRDGRHGTGVDHRRPVQPWDQ
ncbi:pyridoxamine 5'-phosphate oxidase family protein [Nakamurella sp. GG22]